METRVAAAGPACEEPTIRGLGGLVHGLATVGHPSAAVDPLRVPGMR